MNLSLLSDRELVPEIYRRIQGEDEMSRYRLPNWKPNEAQRDAALAHFPGPAAG